MALTPNIRATASNTLAAIRSITPTVRVDQSYSLGAINFPTPNIKADQSNTQVGLNIQSTLRVNQSYTMAAVKGRVQNFHARAWTFTMDGHDFYVLDLGISGTLVYDTLTGQWSEWATGDGNQWYVEAGMNWNANSNQPFNSDAVCGDDTNGTIYYLDSAQAYDGDIGNGLSLNKFSRRLTGGVEKQGRDVMPCNIVYLSGSTGYALSGSTIQLRTSDDFGQTWQDQGSVLANADLNQDVTWFSLGQISNPGRLFEVSDDGAMTRIDSLDMN